MTICLTVDRQWCGLGVGHGHTGTRLFLGYMAVDIMPREPVDHILSICEPAVARADAAEADLLRALHFMHAEGCFNWPNDTSTMDTTTEQYAARVHFSTLYQERCACRRGDQG